MTATCPSGELATGGGWNSDSIDLNVSYAKAGSNTFNVIGINYDTSPASFRAQVICADGPGITAAKVRAKQRDLSATLARIRAAVAKKK